MKAAFQATRQATPQAAQHATQQGATGPTEEPDEEELPAQFMPKAVSQSPRSRAMRTTSWQMRSDLLPVVKFGSRGQFAASSRILDREAHFRPEAVIGVMLRPFKDAGTRNLRGVLPKVAQNSSRVIGTWELCGWPRLLCSCDFHGKFFTQTQASPCGAILGLPKLILSGAGAVDLYQST